MARSGRRVGPRGAPAAVAAGRLEETLETEPTRGLDTLLGKLRLGGSACRRRLPGRRGFHPDTVCPTTSCLLPGRCRQLVHAVRERGVTEVGGWSSQGHREREDDTGGVEREGRSVRSWSRVGAGGHGPSVPPRRRPAPRPPAGPGSGGRSKPRGGGWTERCLGNRLHARAALATLAHVCDRCGPRWFSFLKRGFVLLSCPRRIKTGEEQSQVTCGLCPF